MARLLACLPAQSFRQSEVPITNTLLARSLSQTPAIISALFLSLLPPFLPLLHAPQKASGAAAHILKITRPTHLPPLYSALSSVKLKRLKRRVFFGAKTAALRIRRVVNVAFQCHLRSFVHSPSQLLLCQPSLPHSTFSCPSLHRAAPSLTHSLPPLYSRSTSVRATSHFSGFAPKIAPLSPKTGPEHKERTCLGLATACL